jgi:hypothetical protein
MYKKTFVITIYSETPQHSQEEENFITDMQSRVDSLAAHNFVNTIETDIQEYIVPNNLN